MSQANFIEALRKNYRYSSPRGELNTEQLWDLPLKSKTNFDLDTIARTLYEDLKKESEVSFVEVSSNPSKAILENKLEIVKYVISVRQAENEAARAKAERSKERERLLEILSKKQDSALEQMSIEDIQARLNAL